MSAPNQQIYVQQAVPQQSVMSKLGMGAVMGSLVGLTIGFIGGGFQILRGGPGPRGVMGTLAQYMLSSAATFGFFMSIGSVIRTESLPSSNDAQWRAAYRAAGHRVAMAPRVHASS
ncbi:Similar to S.cerevisiae protein MGR2 (Subunit of the TIM23 translocase complex) [Malassezia sympodialis ATCC 42132]|uniref:Similar to S.cerevisiae protein MGR2 (Subunit of the TIM23 translocase complex) n=2 Tax=Malassezia sympodialis (strain ATCC 42132) TaxID=1230383 RepID=A0A1M8A9K9_MALS4|nr:Similar to S.cerevisiae protein MGR2 (Subunit of the TIM23 translocase complex) [Malassezia sympodialis ATCC 42132]